MLKFAKAVGRSNRWQLCGIFSGYEKFALQSIIHLSTAKYFFFISLPVSISLVIESQIVEIDISPYFHVYHNIILVTMICFQSVYKKIRKSP